MTLENASIEELIWIAITTIGLALNLLETLDSRRDLQAIELRHVQAAAVHETHTDTWDGCFMHRIGALRIAAKRNLRAATVRTIVMGIYVAVGVLAAETAPAVRPALELLNAVVALVFIGSSFLLMLNSALDRRDRARLLEIFEAEVELNQGGVNA